MPREEARVEVDLRSQGADLRAIARELENMSGRKLRDLLKSKLEEAAKPFVPRVQASVMATPRKRPPSPGGLRARIARTVEITTTETDRQVSVAVEVQPQQMPDREHSLPLYYEGTKPRWRHPVFQSRQNPDAPWVTEEPTPFFYQAADDFGRAAAVALEGALEEITPQINGE